MTEALGIDIGSYKTVLASFHHKNVEIILSDSSNKSTPSILAFTEQERLVGDAAQNQMKRNFVNTLQFFPRFLGLNTDCKH